MESELWVRNLSTRHELQVDVPGRPPEPPLPPRRGDGNDRGQARSIPSGVAFLRGSGGCELLVRQVRTLDAAPLSADDADAERTDDSDATVRAPDLPEDLRPVAVALCEPLLRGSQMPSSHAQMAAQLGMTQKAVRILVGKVCQLYADALPDLRRRVEERRQTENRQLGVQASRRLVRGVWVFTVDEPAERQIRALALPDYFEVAYLLVRRGVVQPDDSDLDGGIPR